MTNTSNIKTVSQKVRAQYEDLPYPHRDPKDEILRITLATMECPDQLNHLCFNGEKDFTKKIRVLIAGGGTGDSVVQWAVTLKDNPDAEIVYLDFSAASRAVAEERLKVHDLHHKVKFITDSLLHIPNLNLGKFDIINCSGVLHHLENPEAGLKVLADSLADDGVLVTMLYGKYGRIAVYPIQEIMRYINVDAEDSQEKIDNTKRLLGCITSNNNFYYSLSKFTDYHIDAEVYDIFMHDQDRAYNIKDLYEFAASADLKICGFGQNERGESMDYYSPEKYITNKELLDKVKKLPLKEQQSIAEVLNGNMKKHCFYLSKKERKKLELSLDLVPSFSMCAPVSEQKFLVDTINKSVGVVQMNFYNMPISFLKTPHLAQIVAGIDGVSSLREILSKVMKSSKEKKCNLQTLLAEFKGLFDVLENLYHMHLRQPGIPPYINFTKYQSEKFGHVIKKQLQDQQAQLQ